MYLMYWHLRRLCTWVHSDVILTLFWRSGLAPTARILSTTWRWPQNEPHVKAEKSFCSGNYQTEEVGLQHLNVYECNVVYKAIKQCKMLRQILYALNLRALPIALIMGLLFTRPWRIMLKKFVIMLCSNARKCFDYASKNCYYAHGMLAL